MIKFIHCLYIYNAQTGVVMVSRYRHVTAPPCCFMLYRAFAESLIIIIISPYRRKPSSCNGFTLALDVLEESNKTLTQTLCVRVVIQVISESFIVYRV